MRSPGQVLFVFSGFSLQERVADLTLVLSHCTESSVCAEKVSSLANLD